jgi:hypothetical protein
MILRNPLTDITPEQGAQISGAVALIWALGWAFRMLIQLVRSLSTDGNSTSDD